MYDADDVRRVLPAYGAHVDAEVAKLGRGHPLIRTQYFNEEIDAQAGMFTPARRAMMACDSPRTPSALRAPPPNAGAEPSDLMDAQPAFGGGRVGVGHAIVFTLDVAGQDEAAFHNPEQQMLRNPGRDAVTLTIASVDLSELDTLQAPIFRILQRFQWTGLNHLDVFARLSSLADQWHPQHILVDATGVGEGLWAMLDKRYPTRVRPVKFSAQKKSEIGYRYLAMIETGRVRDCSVRHVVASEAKQSPRQLSDASWRAPTDSPSRADVDRQYEACMSEVLPGPQKHLRWGVPEGTRDPDGNLIHDDIVLADALLAEADGLEWRRHTPTFIIEPVDPLEEMSHFR